MQNLFSILITLYILTSLSFIGCTSSEETPSAEEEQTAIGFNAKVQKNGF